MIQPGPVEPLALDMYQESASNCPEAIARCIRHFNSQLNRLGLMLEDEAPVVWLAGGAIKSFFRGEEPADLDLSFKAHANLQVALGNLAKMPGFELCHEGDHSTRVKVGGVNVDLLAHYYETPQLCVCDFDFTVACAGITATKLIVHPMFFTDLATRSLRVNSFKTPVTTLRRVQKYAAKGFWADAEQTTALMEAVRRLDVDAFLEQSVLPEYGR